MLFIDEDTKKDKKCPKCGKSKCTCKQGTDECNEADIGIDMQLSRLDQYQEEFELFRYMCYADIREMNMIHEGASEEELSVFREEEESKGIVEKIKTAIKKIWEAIKRYCTKAYTFISKQIDNIKHHIFLNAEEVKKAMETAVNGNVKPAIALLNQAQPRVYFEKNKNDFINAVKNSSKQDEEKKEENIKKIEQVEQKEPEKAKIYDYNLKALLEDFPNAKFYTDGIKFIEDNISDIKSNSGVVIVGQIRGSKLMHYFSQEYVKKNIPFNISDTYSLSADGITVSYYKYLLNSSDSDKIIPEESVEVTKELIDFHLKNLDAVENKIKYLKADAEKVISMINSLKINDTNCNVIYVYNLLNAITKSFYDWHIKAIMHYMQTCDKLSKYKIE